MTHTGILTNTRFNQNIKQCQLIGSDSESEVAERSGWSS